MVVVEQEQKVDDAEVKKAVEEPIQAEAVQVNQEEQKEPSHQVIEEKLDEAA